MITTDYLYTIRAKILKDFKPNQYLTRNQWIHFIDILIQKSLEEE